MKRILVFILITLGLLALAAGGAVVGGYYYVQNQFTAPGPSGTNEAPATVMVERGMGLKAIAALLEREGLITDARLFELGVRLRQAGGELKAGEYAIPPGASMAEILAILMTGKSIQYKLTVPEGFALIQVLKLVEADPVLVGEITVEPKEGYLLPETYLFTRGTTRDELLRRMEADKRAVLEELWPARQDDLPFDTMEEAVILASIVEKETGVAEERPLVASVFVNRLRRGMRLQSDPTIIYGITQGEPLGRRIRRSELDAKTPYNTYQIDGLPPTPICNPGRASMEAVLNPPQTDYLYFVADGTGGHAFAKTLEEHNRNVANWRRIQRERGLR